MPPMVSRATSARRVQSSILRTSAVTALPQPAWAATSSSRSRRRAAMSSSAPSLPERTAKARPIPADAPTTTTRLPANVRSLMAPSFSRSQPARIAFLENISTYIVQLRLWPVLPRGARSAKTVDRERFDVAPHGLRLGHVECLGLVDGREGIDDASQPFASGRHIDAGTDFAAFPGVAHVRHEKCRGAAHGAVTVGDHVPHQLCVIGH